MPCPVRIDGRDWMWVSDSFVLVLVVVLVSAEILPSNDEEDDLALLPTSNHTHIRPGNRNASIPRFETRANNSHHPSTCRVARNDKAWLRRVFSNTRTGSTFGK